MPPPPHLPPMLAGPPAYPTLPRRRDASVSPPLRRRNAMYVARDRDVPPPHPLPVESVHLPLRSLSTRATPVPGSTIIPHGSSRRLGPVASAATGVRAVLGAGIGSATPTPTPPTPRGN
ncbi:hypothetical protein AMAG_19989 [Allomyces macrogynus ATCC 38327]|uniref:Uncharacterized protein n=1 Tax=Allomyces macrogynus (strain ATCC 38327) TaxID=578462 RepID=A0A0L0T495_ALLM3|nr:hypothetical protein AMAG_19989 [Allomyces macrogynus ATCC 38327]|eukprot:KNE69530.1 hypothetical protein AMAG_19989 [Allomyces macrogynus ATCC 38327]